MRPEDVLTAIVECTPCYTCRHILAHTVIRISHLADATSDEQAAFTCDVIGITPVAGVFVSGFSSFPNLGDTVVFQDLSPFLFPCLHSAIVNFGTIRHAKQEMRAISI